MIIKVLGKNYPVRIAAPGNTETGHSFFRNGFSRDRVWTYPRMVSFEKQKVRAFYISPFLGGTGDRLCDDLSRTSEL